GESAAKGTAVDLPGRLAGPFPNGHQIRSNVLIADQQDQITGQDRGSPCAMLGDRDGKRFAPKLAAIRGIGGQSVGPEVDADHRAVGHWSCCCRAAQLGAPFDLAWEKRASPTQFSLLSAVAEGDQFVAFEPGEEQLISLKAGRGGALRRASLPQDIRGRAEVDGERAGADPGPIRAPKT